MSDSRLIVIDGYNLILRSPELKPGPDRTLRQSREKLLNMLSWVLGGSEVRFLVVFDGSEGGSRDHHSGRVEVRYSRPPDKADDLIRRIVEDQVDRVDRLSVVTADLEVARHARAMGADVSIADMFLASALGPTRPDEEEKPTTLTRKELEEWAEVFRRGKPQPPSEDDA